MGTHLINFQHSLLVAHVDQLVSIQVSYKAVTSACHSITSKDSLAINDGFLISKTQQRTWHSWFSKRLWHWMSHAVSTKQMNQKGRLLKKGRTLLHNARSSRQLPGSVASLSSPLVVCCFTTRRWRTPNLYTSFENPFFQPVWFCRVCGYSSNNQHLTSRRKEHNIF